MILPAGADEASGDSLLKTMLPPDDVIQMRIQRNHQAPIGDLSYSPREPSHLIGDLLPLLDDPDLQARLQALMHFRGLRDADQVGRIADAARQLLDDPHPQVREFAELIAAQSPD